MSADGTTPLKGSRAVKTWTDALGRTSLIQHYTATDLTTWTNTGYSYEARNKLAKVTDAAGNNWTYAYDARGRMTGSDDPDMGQTEFGYDGLDRQIWSKDSAGRTQYTKYDALGRKTELRDNAANGPLVASWTFDTLPGAKGQAVASTRYEAGAAYTSEITGYDAEYRPTGSKTTIPDTPATKGLAGTYAYSTTYTPTGKVQSTTVPATPGGLAAERLITRYNGDDAPVSLSGLSWYTADTVYSPFGEVLRTASGKAPQRVWTTNLYNPNTGQVTDSITDRETGGPNRISALSYKYDPAGNITSVTDDQPGGRTDRQCYAYDPMGRLTQAWTGKTESCTGPSLGDVTPGPDGDGYWKTYGFDAIGNRTKLVDHDLTNPALDDETTYSYGITIAGNGTQPPVKTKPHALASVDETTRKPGSTVNSQSTYAYDSSGNTTRRTIGGDTQTLNWDRRNKLTSADSPGIGSVAVTGLSGKCLDVSEGLSADGTAIQLWSCNETKAQQWRLTGDTVRALDKCLTADAAGLLTLATCDGSAKQKFTYRAGDKTLYNPASDTCVDVPGSNDANGTDLKLWYCNGGTNQQWSFANTTTYLYDAGGNRLIEETGTSRTLYLGEAEITVNKAGQPIDAVRYYSSPGAPHDGSQHRWQDHRPQAEPPGGGPPQHGHHQHRPVTRPGRHPPQVGPVRQPSRRPPRGLARQPHLPRHRQRRQHDEPHPHRRPRVRTGHRPFHLRRPRHRHHGPAPDERVHLRGRQPHLQLRPDGSQARQLRIRQQLHRKRRADRRARIKQLQSAAGRSATTVELEAEVKFEANVEEVQLLLLVHLQEGGEVLQELHQRAQGGHRQHRHRGGRRYRLCGGGRRGRCRHGRHRVRGSGRLRRLGRRRRRGGQQPHGPQGRPQRHGRTEGRGSRRRGGRGGRRTRRGRRTGPRGGRQGRGQGNGEGPGQGLSQGRMSRAQQLRRGQPRPHGGRHVTADRRTGTRRQGPRHRPRIGRDRHQGSHRDDPG
ncbi:hypothetical protein GCM10020254_21540 [Streptomyces goshikiensis]